MKAPRFWQDKGLFSTLMIPLSWLYRLTSFARAFITQPYRASLPVICVGNITSGGTGKTPVSAYLAALAIKKGLSPVILSRGYGGTLSGPCFVDPEHHLASHCGDEPLLLQQIAPVVIARNRAEGAKFIESQKRFDVIIMDDGMQNPQLYKDKLIIVFDGAVGIENGRILPAGPLRTSLFEGARQADLIIMNGADETGLTALLSQQFQQSGADIITATLQADETIPHIEKQTPLYAFAGIGRPERFFNTLNEQGFFLTQTKAFGDHHPYSQADISGMIEAARALSALLITTSKDWVRLSKAHQKHIAYLPVSLHISSLDHAKFEALLPPKSRAKAR